jgi:hypothetical protein
MPLDDKESQERRARNRAAGVAALEKAGVPFTTNNAGVHVMIQHNGKQLNYWPGTGLWHYPTASGRIERRGIRSLLQFLGKDAS